MTHALSSLIGWTIVYVDDGVTWVAPHQRGQGKYYGRVFSKSEAEHRLAEMVEDGIEGQVVAIYAEPAG